MKTTKLDLENILDVIEVNDSTAIDVLTALGLSEQTHSTMTMEMVKAVTGPVLNHPADEPFNKVKMYDVIIRRAMELATNEAELFTCIVCGNEALVQAIQYRENPELMIRMMFEGLLQ
jgi:hypothetical protein